MLYCAYGSNMNLEQMAYRCPNSKIVGTGQIKNYQLVFNMCADIIKSDNAENFVPVVLWEIAEEDWERLDIYEGYPHFYTKEVVTVSCGKNNVEAIVYVMTDDNKGIEPPMYDYFMGILAGYTENNINTKPLYDALKHSQEHKTVHSKYVYGRLSKKLNRR